MAEKLVITGKLFTGNKESCQNFIRGTNQYYVYLLRRPSGKPFYVGKGKDYRVLEHENEARHPNDRKSNAYKLNVIRSIWKADSDVNYEIDSIFEREEAAYAREEELITRFKRLHEGGPLTNLSPGDGSTAGASPISKAKHTATLGGIPEDNPERAVLNEFVLGIGKMKSIILKPISQFSPRPTQIYPNKVLKPSFRQAVAIAAAAAANGISIDSSCEIPRRVEISNVKGFVENGVACDIKTSGMATVVPSENPADELFKLTNEQARTVVGMVGMVKCVNLGIVGDDYFGNMT